MSPNVSECHQMCSKHSKTHQNTVRRTVRLTYRVACTRLKNTFCTFPFRSEKSSPRPGENPNQKKKNDKNQPKAVKPVSLSVAAKSLSQEALEKALSHSKKAFPNSTLLWLKDVASFLNVHFEEVGQAGFKRKVAVSDV